MTTVSTKKELSSALQKGENEIKCVGYIAENIRKRKKVKKGAKFAGLGLMAAGALALPFTGGASAAGVVAGAGLTVGTMTISIAELAILCGTSVALYGIVKNYNVDFKNDGSVILKKQ